MRATRRIFGKVLAVLLVAVLTAGLGACAAEDDPVHDFVLAGGRVMDPESGTDAILDVGITGDRIEAVSEGPLAGARIIDASGLRRPRTHAPRGGARLR